MDLAPGTILLGKYRIEGLIGSGGMGNVVRASHLYLHQPVAIKILLSQMAESESTKQRFLREAQATVKLKSEHCARVMDVGTTPEGVPFMVMEYLEGNDLNQILRHHGAQLPAIVVDLMLQACEGIAEAHALGIVHRDIKPSNFFITQRPDGSMLLKILDFGISKSPVGYEDLTGTQTVLGTPSYMAPEQMKSGRSADPRSDIWSIGVVMYQLIAGRPPFDGETYADLVLKVGLEPPAPLHVPLPGGLAEVILRCLEKDPQQRHQNVGELARMLAPYASDPISASQSAGRAMRILQGRGMSLSMQGSPLAAGGGLLPPVPLSPAQLTPHSWAPPSHGTSLSHGAGQMTVRTRGSRGLVIGGIVGLCVLAGVGGYAVSQMSKSEPAQSQPLPAPPVASEPPAAAPTAATAAPAAGSAAPALTADSAAAATAPAPAAGSASAAAAPAPAAGSATSTAPAGTDPAPTPSHDDAPTTWKPTTPAPTIVEPPTKAVEAKPADTKPVDTRPTAPKAASTTPASKKPASKKPASKKPASKKTNDLFDSRH